MIKCKILDGLYYNTAPSYPMKGICSEHMSCFHNRTIDRQVYKIIDLELWFKSDFKEGEKLITKRISERSKYEFKR